MLALKKEIEQEMSDVELPASTTSGNGTSVIVLKSGFATKEGLLWKTWRRRWFVLRTILPMEVRAVEGQIKPTHVLMYYSTEKEAVIGEKPSGIVYLSKGHTTVSKTSRSGRECLQIQTSGCDRIYFVQPEEDKEEWLSVLNTLS
eukprot:m.62024 g.62024  ORF g.62024 m.62024 type:complete len:145 (+) comp15785_c0_seq1:222-656(+)